MNAPVADLVKLCPGCGSERPAAELYCEHAHPDGRECGYDLTDVRATTRGAPALAG